MKWAPYSPFHPHFDMLAVDRRVCLGGMWTKGGFTLALVSAWGGKSEVHWNRCSSNFSFPNKFIIVLLCGLQVDINIFLNCLTG